MICNFRVNVQFANVPEIKEKWKCFLKVIGRPLH